METAKSPRMVMLWAHHLGKQVLPEYSGKFSRRDFTLPQLFACLVIREHQKKSYRGVEALLRDCPEWLAAIGMVRAPDHNTLWRAFNYFVRAPVVNLMVDLQTRWAAQRKLFKGRIRLAALDSSMFESRHVSRHFEERQRQTARADRKKQRKSSGKAAGDRRRSRVVRGLPKLSLAVAPGCHLILAARATTGGGADQRLFEPLLLDAWRRADINTAVADAGFDS